MGGEEKDWSVGVGVVVRWMIDDAEDVGCGRWDVLAARGVAITHRGWWHANLGVQ